MLLLCVALSGWCRGHITSMRKVVEGTARDPCNAYHFSQYAPSTPDWMLLDIMDWNHCTYTHNLHQSTVTLSLRIFLPSPFSYHYISHLFFLYVKFQSIASLLSYSIIMDYSYLMTLNYTL